MSQVLLYLLREILYAEEGVLIDSLLAGVLAELILSKRKKRRCQCCYRKSNYTGASYIDDVFVSHESTVEDSLIEDLFTDPALGIKLKLERKNNIAINYLAL